VIQVADLVKRYRKAHRNAVDGISFAVGGGEFFALLGPNGAGKTTTISILTPTLLPTGGSATIAGHDLVTEASAVRRLVGIIFQRPSLDQNLTGEENVRLHAILYGVHPYAPERACARGPRVGCVPASSCLRVKILVPGGSNLDHQTPTCPIREREDALGAPFLPTAHGRDLDARIH